jgi:hypothetical protein
MLYKVIYLSVIVKKHQVCRYNGVVFRKNIRVTRQNVSWANGLGTIENLQILQYELGAPQRNRNIKAISERPHLHLQDAKVTKKKINISKERTKYL